MRLEQTAHRSGWAQSSREESSPRIAFALSWYGQRCR